MSYLSKSKWMYFSSGIEANSAGAGRAVVAAGAGAAAGVDGVLGTGAACAGVREDLPPAEAMRLKREVPPIRSPGRALVAAGTGGETTRVRAVRFLRPAVVRALSLRVDDLVALRLLALLGVKVAPVFLPDGLLV